MSTRGTNTGPTGADEASAEDKELTLTPEEHEKPTSELERLEDLGIISHEVREGLQKPLAANVAPDAQNTSTDPEAPGEASAAHGLEVTALEHRSDEENDVVMAELAPNHYRELPASEETSHDQNKKSWNLKSIQGYRSLRENHGWRQADTLARSGGSALGWGFGSDYIVNRATGGVFLTQFPTYIAGAASAAVAALPLVPRGLGLLRHAIGKIPWKWCRNCRTRIEKVAETGFNTALQQWQKDCQILPVELCDQVEAEKRKSTHELVNTDAEEVLITAFDTYLMQHCGEIPMFPTIDGYIQFLFPQLVKFCKSVARDNPPDPSKKDEKWESRDPRIRRLNLSRADRDVIAEYAGANLAVTEIDSTNEETKAATAKSAAEANDRWKNLRQVTVAHAQGLRKWHSERSSGQINGALAANALVLGNVAGPIGVLACGAVAAARFGINEYRFHDVDMERGKDGKLLVNMDPEHYDEGGRSLYSQGNFIADLMGDSEKTIRKQWAEDEKIKDWLGRIRNLAIGDAELKTCSLRSPHQLGMRFAKRVQKGLAVSTEKKKVRGKKKSDAEIAQKKDEIEQAEKGRAVAMNILTDSPGKIADLKRVAEDKRIAFETEQTNVASSQRRRVSKTAERESESNGLEQQIKRLNAQIEAHRAKEAYDAQNKADRMRGLEEKKRSTEEKTQELRQQKKVIEDSIAAAQQPVGNEEVTPAQREELKTIEEKIRSLEKELKENEGDIRSERMVVADMTIQTAITTLENKVAAMEKKRSEVLGEMERWERATIDETQKVATLGREHSNAAAAVESEEARLSQAKQDLKDSGRFAPETLLGLRKKLEDLEKDSEIIMKSDEIGKSDDASKAFAIWTVESWERLKNKSGGFSRFFMPVLGPVSAVLGEGAKEVVKVAGGAALSGVAAGTAVFVGGKILVVLGATDIGAALASSIGWGLGGVGFGVLAGYGLAKDAWKNFAWGRKASTEKKKE